jgi:hypothetical protein
MELSFISETCTLTHLLPCPAKVRYAVSPSGILGCQEKVCSKFQVSVCHRLNEMSLKICFVPQWVLQSALGFKKLGLSI